MNREHAPRTCRFVALILFAMSAAHAASAPGVPNFHQVNNQLYRGAQPTPEGLKSLARLGVKTVIDLRRPEEHSLQEQKIVQSLGMKYVHLPMKGRRFPSDADIHKAMTLINNESSQPVFVHCREGKDRTGLVVACYRISHDGWTNRRALAEAKSYGMHRQETEIKHYIEQYHPPQQAQK